MIVNFFILLFCREIIECDGIFYLSYDELVKLISFNELKDLSKEKVRNLVSKEYLYNRIRKKPQLQNSIECVIIIWYYHYCKFKLLLKS